MPAPTTLVTCLRMKSSASPNAAIGRSSGDHPDLDRGALRVGGDHPEDRRRGDESGGDFDDVASRYGSVFSLFSIIGMASSQKNSRRARDGLSLIPPYSRRRRRGYGRCRSPRPWTRGTEAAPRDRPVRRAAPSARGRESRRASSLARSSSPNIQAVSGERNTVGAIALTVMPVGPHSHPSARVIPSIAAFEAQ